MSTLATEVRQMFRDKNIGHLFHANTVLTTLSYLNVGGILSRGAIEDRGLPQTPQSTDSQDKELGIWYDIFFDSVDIHERAKELNKYGPLTLIFDLDLLLLDGLDIHITKDNPIRWNNNTPNSERYFESVESLCDEYKKGAFYQHLTIRNMANPIPFIPYLQQIVIDNPRLPSNEHFEGAFSTLQDILQQRYPDTNLVIRECSGNCRCTSQYKSFKTGAIWYKYRIE